MKMKNAFRILLGVETAVFLAIVSGIALLEPDQAAELWLFELVGAVSASMITTYGIYRMKALT